MKKRIAYLDFLRGLAIMMVVGIHTYSLGEDSTGVRRLRRFWTEIVRRMSTQKAITTEGTNALGAKVRFRQCSEPNKAAEDIYQRLNYKKMPFRKFKIL